MIISDTYLDTLLKSILQKTISFEIDKKTFKTGKFILYSQKYFLITFVLSSDKKKQEKIDIPIPFNIEVHKDDSLIYFDYRIATLAHNDKNLIKQLQDATTIKNKFLNKILTITLLD